MRVDVSGPERATASSSTERTHAASSGPGEAYPVRSSTTCWPWAARASLDVNARRTVKLDLNPSVRRTLGEGMTIHRARAPACPAAAFSQRPARRAETWAPTIFVATIAAVNWVNGVPSWRAISFTSALMTVALGATNTASMA